jgi:hypothetical protein
MISTLITESPMLAGAQLLEVISLPPDPRSVPSLPALARTWVALARVGNLRALQYLLIKTHQAALMDNGCYPVLSCIHCGGPRCYHHRVTTLGRGSCWMSSWWVLKSSEWSAKLLTLELDLLVRINRYFNSLNVTFKTAKAKRI